MMKRANAHHHQLPSLGCAIRADVLGHQVSGSRRPLYGSVFSTQIALPTVVVSLLRSKDKGKGIFQNEVMNTVLSKMINPVFRCPYCILGNHFQPLVVQNDIFLCPKCGHVKEPGDESFKCACHKCEELRAFD